MMFLASPKLYTPVTFEEFVATLTWKAWRPKFITLHNTGVPTLAEWMNPKTPEATRVAGQDDYEKRIMHWHSGVHLFVTPDGIWNTCDLTQDGVSVSCWNSETIGVEMVGNYALPAENQKGVEIDDWNSQNAVLVRDHAVAALAILHDRLGIRPDDFVVGVKGLHFHHECARDGHACPGGQVVKADMVSRVLAQMNAQNLTS